MFSKLPPYSSSLLLRHGHINDDIKASSEPNNSTPSKPASFARLAASTNSSIISFI